MSPGLVLPLTTRTRALWGVGDSSPAGVGLGLTERWGEGGDVQDEEDDIDDAGSLAIEVPPPDHSGPVILKPRSRSDSPQSAHRLRITVPSLSTLPLGTHRKPA